MSFYRERQVKVPRKQYVCGYCQQAITGAHVYVSGINAWGDFAVRRVHNKCHEQMREICDKCLRRQNDYCKDISDCFHENFTLEEKTES